MKSEHGGSEHGGCFLWVGTKTPGVIACSQCGKEVDCRIPIKPKLNFDIFKLNWHFIWCDAVEPKAVFVCPEESHSHIKGYDHIYPIEKITIEDIREEIKAYRGEKAEKKEGTQGTS